MNIASPVPARQVWGLSGYQWLVILAAWLGWGLGGGGGAGGRDRAAVATRAGGRAALHGLAAGAFSGDVRQRSVHAPARRDRRESAPGVATRFSVRPVAGGGGGDAAAGGEG